MKKPKIQVLSQRCEYKGRKISLELLEVQYTTGVVATRELVKHPGAVAILPFLTEDAILLNRQPRVGAGEELWEIPAGTLEEGESPRSCAERELLEETGYTARHWKQLGKFYPTPGYSSEIIYIYLAKELIKSDSSPLGHREEGISNQAFSLSEVYKMVQKGEIVDGKTLVALLLFKELSPK